MIQRMFASLLVVGLLSACSGDGGSSYPSSAGDPAVNPNRPVVNPNRPAVNPNQPASSAAGGAPQTGGDGNHAGGDNMGPGNSCTPAKNCDCKNSPRKTCICLGEDAALCAQLPN